ncbi:uncharacterized protein LOC119312068 [Triticum dicoccoides]|uniref:uncharacterized protein LOC119312068 n=1 Tax=Triticum dicoccoides TaxID=85692 RepID=UPI001891D038|nr:uncharacterized protein LOC119312068 [Triticum dicoccoides]
MPISSLCPAHGSRCGAPLRPDLTWERPDPCVSASLRAPPWSTVFSSAGAALSRRRPMPWLPPSRTTCHGRLPASPASGPLHDQIRSSAPRSARHDGPLSSRAPAPCAAAAVPCHGRLPPERRAMAASLPLPQVGLCAPGLAD